MAFCIPTIPILNVTSFPRNYLVDAIASARERNFPEVLLLLMIVTTLIGMHLQDLTNCI